MRMDVRIIPIEIPFKTAFSHSKARRKASSAVMICVNDGTYSGYGEGCPRDYVTGETLDGAIGWLRARAGGWAAEVNSLGDLRRLIIRNAHDIDANPSAFCAFELAMLDLLARRDGVTLEGLLGVVVVDRPVAVSAVLGSDNPLVHWLQAWRFKAAGMCDAKLKIGGDARRNRQRVAPLSRFARLRLDGNNLWPSADAAIAGLNALRGRVWAVEEPVQVRDFAGMMQIHAATGMKIILDESLLNADDLAILLALKPDPAAFVINIRVSKMGGLLRSLGLIDQLRGLGFGLILGAQVGETSCLTRAGLVLLGSMGPVLGYEGAYGTHLLKEDIFTPSLTFDANGLLMPHGLGETGLGLRPVPRLLQMFGDEIPTR